MVKRKNPRFDLLRPRWEPYSRSRLLPHPMWNPRLTTKALLDLKSRLELLMRRTRVSSVAQRCRREALIDEETPKGVRCPSGHHCRRETKVLIAPARLLPPGPPGKQLGVLPYPEGVRIRRRLDAPPEHHEFLFPTARRSPRAFCAPGRRDPGGLSLAGLSEMFSPVAARCDSPGLRGDPEMGGSVRPRRVVHRRPVTSDRYSDSHPALL